MADNERQHADPVRRWVHPDDFDGALAQRDEARREAKKFERRWKRAEQKLAEVERMLGRQIDGSWCEVCLAHGDHDTAIHAAYRRACPAEQSDGPGAGTEMADSARPAESVAPYEDRTFEMWVVDAHVPNGRLQPKNSAAALESVKFYMTCQNVNEVTVRRVEVRQTRTILTALTDGHGWISEDGAP